MFRHLLFAVCLWSTTCLPASAQTPGQGIALPTVNTGQLQKRSPVPSALIGTQMKLLTAYDRHLAYNPAARATKLYADNAFIVELAFSGLPEGTLEVDIDKSRYPAGSIENTNPSPERVGSSRQLTRNVAITLKSGAVPADGVVFLHVLAKITLPDGSKQTLPFSNVHVIVIPMRRFAFADTARFSSQFAMQPKFGFDADACEGESWTPAGTYPVGKSERNKKLVFNIRSGPLGTSCDWISRQENTSQPGYPWKVIAITWSSRASSQCKRPQPEFNRGPPPAGMDLRTDWVQVGNGRQVMANLSLPSHRLPVMLLALNCNNTFLNDHYLEVVWESIELEGPADASTNNIF